MCKNFKLLISLILSFSFLVNVVAEENIESENNSNSSDLQNTETVQNTEELPNIYTFINKDSVNKNVITKEQIEQMNVQSVTDILAKEGIQILSFGDYGTEQRVSIRGFTDETVRVVIDGVCVNDPLFGKFDFSTLNIENIEKIEIIRGGFNEGIAEEGAVAGVVVITTKKQSLGHSISTDTFTRTFFYKKKPLDTFGQSINYAGQISDNSFLSVSLKGVYANNNFLYINYLDKLHVRKNATAKDLTSDVTYSYFFGNGNTFSIFDSFYAGYLMCPGSEDSEKTDVLDDFNNRLTFNLQMPSIKDCVKLESSLSYKTNHEFYFEDTGNSTHNLDVITFDISGKYYKLEHYQQLLGISAEASFLNSTDCGVHTQLKFTAKETSKIIFTPTFYITIPLSFSVCDDNFAFIPKIAITKEFKYLDLTVDSYRMVQFPIMQDLYWKSSTWNGNADLKPEDGVAAEVVLDFKNKIIPFTVNPFTYYYFNKIKSTGTTCENVASAFYAGCNVKSDLSFFKDKLTFTFNVEYLYTRLLDESNSSTYGKKIMWTPDWVVSLICILNLDYVTVSADFNYMGVRYTENSNLVAMDPYLLGNICVQYKGVKNWIFYCKAQNIFNVDYQCVPDYPEPLFNMSFGVKFNKNFN